jgi:hypothetical protein
MTFNNLNLPTAVDYPAEDTVLASVRELVRLKPWRNRSWYLDTTFDQFKVGDIAFYDLLVTKVIG